MDVWMHRVLMVAVLIVAVMIHEVAHGLAALWCGDRTALERGRITLNPLRHIDPIGTILLPGLLALAGSSVVFGWAKPVPVDLSRTRNPRKALWITAVAGPLSNLVQAILAAGALRGLGPLGLLPPWLAMLLVITILINIVLLVFNLIPIPPLDGSRVLAALLPQEWVSGYLSLGKFGFLLLFLLLQTKIIGKVMEPALGLILNWLVPGLA